MHTTPVELLQQLNSVYRVPAQPGQPVHHDDVAIPHGGLQLGKGRTTGAQPRHLLLKEAGAAGVG